MKKKILIILGVILGTAYAISNAAIVLNFLNITPTVNQSSLIHFVAPGNDFVGSIFWLGNKAIQTPIIISLGSSTKTCASLIQGMYFNSQRGKRVRPLDTNTLTALRKENSAYSNLTMSGGLYTFCDGGRNSGVFGAITYTWGNMTSHLVAGIKLDYRNNRILTGLANSFQYFDKKYPIGYIYDSVGGIGYVGQSPNEGGGMGYTGGILTGVEGNLSGGHENLISFLNNGGSINSGFMYSGNKIISTNTGSTGWIMNMTINTGIDTAKNLIIQGSIGLSQGITEASRLQLLSSLQNKTIIYNGSDINSSTLINAAKQKAQALCQGKTINPDIQTNDSILCYENSDVTIDLAQTTTYENKTIIIKSGNVVLEGGMSETSPSLDIFIDRGLMYLPSSFDGQSFNDQGYPVVVGVSSGLYLKGNFIINGLMVGGTEGIFEHKLHIQGKITMLNTPIQPTDGKLTQIENIFGSTIYNNIIYLKNIFIRTCGTNGIGSDDAACKTGDLISTTPLIILNGNYPSNILQ